MSINCAVLKGYQLTNGNYLIIKKPCFESEQHPLLNPRIWLRYFLAKKAKGQTWF